MTSESANTFTRRILRLAGVALLVAGVGALGVLGWRWRTSATVQHVAVKGATHAPPDTVRRLARVDTGAAISEVNRMLVADRVERHPWVRRAEVTAQWLRRTLTIVVTERTPAALVVDAQGRPAYYLDRAGYAMPLPDSTGYDVPLVRGLDARYHPIRRIAPPSLRRTLGVLASEQPFDLVAEIIVQPDSTVQLVTAPTRHHGSIPVRLGSGHVPRKIQTLQAFARQVLATQSETSIQYIDLRFEDQVVAREQPPG